MAEITMYITLRPYRSWRWMLSDKFRESKVGIFRNLPYVIPGRWGFFVLGFEVGSRSPGDPVGVWLKERGLWPW